MDLLHHLEKGKEELSPLQYHIKSLHIISRHLQEESAKKSNISWIWRIIYGHKLPYMKKTRMKKQVCGAACFMAAEIKFSKDVRPSVCPSVRLWTESCPLCIFNNTRWIHFILHILSSNFRRCGSYKVCFHIQKFEILPNSLNSFDLGSNMTQ